MQDDGLSMTGSQACTLALRRDESTWVKLHTGTYPVLSQHDMPYCGIQVLLLILHLSSVWPFAKLPHSHQRTSFTTFIFSQSLPIIPRQNIVFWAMRPPWLSIPIQRASVHHTEAGGADDLIMDQSQPQNQQAQAPNIPSKWSLACL